MTGDLPVSDRMNKLTDPELGYIARWVALTHPEVAEKALVALAEYRRDYPDKARMFLGPEYGKVAQ